jgi:hypothetical protein
MFEVAKTVDYEAMTNEDYPTSRHFNSDSLPILERESRTVLIGCVVDVDWTKAMHINSCS